MSDRHRRFVDQYGQWAVVAGASEGLGAAFATELARRGLGLVLVARRAAPLETLAEQLRVQHRVDVVTHAADLGDADAVDRLVAVCGERQVGLVVANAATVPIGPFAAADPAQLAHAVAVNCAGTLRLARAFLPPMAGRGRGGMVVMASMAGLQGSPMLSTYAATKAFDLVLAEGLWHEFAHHGVHVVGCAAGAIDADKLGATKQRRAPGTLRPEAVVRDSLASLGRGPRVIPGALNRAAAVLMTRLLPRRTAVRVMARNTTDLRSPGGPG